MYDQIFVVALKCLIKRKNVIFTP